VRPSDGNSALTHVEIRLSRRGEVFDPATLVTRMSNRWRGARPQSRLSDRGNLRSPITGRGTPSAAIMKARAPPAKTEAIDSSNGISVDIGIVIPKLMVFSNESAVTPVAVSAPVVSAEPLQNIRKVLMANGRPVRHINFVAALLFPRHRASLPDRLAALLLARLLSLACHLTRSTSYRSLMNTRRLRGISRRQRSCHVRLAISDDRTVQ
jgi:hypothetical protein